MGYGFDGVNTSAKRRRKDQVLGNVYENHDKILLQPFLTQGFSYCDSGFIQKGAVLPISLRVENISPLYFSLLEK